MEVLQFHKCSGSYVSTLCFHHLSDTPVFDSSVIFKEKYGIWAWVTLILQFVTHCVPLAPCTTTYTRPKLTKQTGDHVPWHLPTLCHNSLEGMWNANKLASLWAVCFHFTISGHSFLEPIMQLLCVCRMSHYHTVHISVFKGKRFIRMQEAVTIFTTACNTFMWVTEQKKEQGVCQCDQQLSK